MSNTWRIGAIIALPSLLACADPEAVSETAGGWAGTVDTLPSGRVLVQNPDEPSWASGAEWELREAFRVGSLEGDGPDVFGEIRDIELGPAGELYVLDGQASEIRVFGPGGEHIRTFGRSGQGPGELTRPAGMALGPDGLLWVMNWGNARYTAFDPNVGEMVSERRRLAAFTSIPWPGLFDREGRLLDMGLSLEGGQPVLLRLDTAFVATDTLPMPQSDDRHRIAFRRGEVMYRSMMVPFAPRPAWSPRPGGGIVVGEGAAYRLHRIGFDSDTTMTIEVLREPVPVSRAERDSASAAFRERVQEMGGLKPDREPRIPETKPAHGALFVDDEDRVWVRRTPDAGEDPAWDVIDADGRFLGSVSVPVRLAFVTPVLRDNRLALVTEPDGVPIVVVYDLVGAN